MTDDKTALLEKEIARLNLIIEALVFQNQALKRGYSVNENINPSPEFGYSVNEKINGITDIGSSVNEKVKGITEFGSSINENVKGITEFGSSVNENVKGITELWRPLPEKVEPVWDNIYKIRQKLRATEKKKVKYSASENNAKLLIHFHNKSNSDHPTLRKLTDLSEGGLAKMIMSLTRRGLIVRDGWQKFALTASAKNLVGEALG